MLTLLTAVGITLADQATKFLVRKYFCLYEARALIPGFFDLRYIQNTGAAWGIFAGGHLWLAVFSILVLAFLIVFRRSFFRPVMIDQLTFGLIVGGIVGNFIDRVRLHYVVDFLDFYWKGRHFPAFNVADASICIGVGLYIMLQMIQAREKAGSTPEEEADGV